MTKPNGNRSLCYYHHNFSITRVISITMSLFNCLIYVVDPVIGKLNRLVWVQPDAKAERYKLVNSSLVGWRIVIARVVIPWQWHWVTSECCSTSHRVKSNSLPLLNMICSFDYLNLWVATCPTRQIKPTEISKPFHQHTWRCHSERVAPTHKTTSFN